MPGFNDGDTAPHYVYNPTTREWTMFAEYEDGYVGTMKGHTSAGHGNCQAFQVEILGYSDGTYVPWVGDFTDENYADLAEFLAWARDRYGIGRAVTSTPDGGWLYGTSSPHRLSDSEWDSFSGLTCHGAVPGNTHWDTGVLDLDIINSLADEVTDCVPDWYNYDEYWTPYVDAVWPGGAPEECKPITHWEMSVILRKLGLT